MWCIVDVAACWCRLLPDTPTENGRVLPTLAIAVSSSIRGQRVGASVLDAFLIWYVTYDPITIIALSTDCIHMYMTHMYMLYSCSARSVPAVRLTVSPQNTHAIALYRSRSFRVVQSSDKEMIMHWYGHDSIAATSVPIAGHHHTEAAS